jgi:DNA polymerase III epsilon subunit-like protein
MKYVSIDLETTGLNHEKCSILEFAAVVDDLNVQEPIEKLPKFQVYVMQDYYTGEPYALAMHCDKLQKITNWRTSGIDVCTPETLVAKFQTFLVTFGYKETLRTQSYLKDGYIKINVAGKNFANFDNRFLERLPDYNKRIKVGHRILDPVMLYFDPKKDIDHLPSMTECMERAGIGGEVPHSALEDAMLVVQLIRKKFPIKIDK